jgi:hypothetical protein
MKASQTRRLLLALAILTLTSAIPGNFAFAATPYHIDSLTVEERNDFVLEPAKQEVFLNPGESVTNTIYITDRVHNDTTFSVSIQDFKGTDDPNAPVAIVNPGDKAPQSGKDFLSVPMQKFTLSFGQRIAIPVTISVPANASPGGYYAAVLVSNEPSVTASDNSTVLNSTRIISRLGTLFFVRVNGPANPKGQLQDFRVNAPTNKWVYGSGPFSFEILFNNTGNIYLTPYGTVTIKNSLGKTIEVLPVDAYYSLPQSVRYREVFWNQAALFGRYTATLELHRGYGEAVDTHTLVLWVIPWKFLIIAFVIIFAVVFAIIFFLRKFEIKLK